MRVVVNQEGCNQSITVKGFNATSNNDHGGFTMVVMHPFIELSLGSYIRRSLSCKIIIQLYSYLSTNLREL